MTPRTLHSWPVYCLETNGDNAEYACMRAMQHRCIMRHRSLDAVLPNGVCTLQTQLESGARKRHLTRCSRLFALDRSAHGVPD